MWSVGRIGPGRGVGTVASVDLSRPIRTACSGMFPYPEETFGSFSCPLAPYCSGYFGAAIPLDAREL